MRRLVFCFDGTWNRIDGNYPTNVARTAQAISRHDRDTAQIIYYDEGVGTSATDRFTGGILGHGLTEKIIEAYHFLVMNYEPGDEIYAFGFSRGAFIARSFVGLIRNCGIISRRSLVHIRDAVTMYLSRQESDRPGSEKLRNFRLQHCPKLCLPGDRHWREAKQGIDQAASIDLSVAYLGVWDTVGALGIPKHLSVLGILNRKYAFHDTDLSGFVKRARHAVAIDERRRAFEPALWTNLDDLNASDSAEPQEIRYQQILFPGVHAAVGGGGPIRGLSDAALEWVVQGARLAGLAFDTDDQSPLYDLRPDHRAQLFNATGKRTWSWKDRLMGAGLADRAFPEFDVSSLHKTVEWRYATPASALPEGTAYRPFAIRTLFGALEQSALRIRAELAKRQIELKARGDTRALQAPSSVKRYVIRPRDTLPAIAEREMGSADDADILSLHNKNAGLLFEDDGLYAGAELEIPTYDKGPAQAPQTPSPEPDAVVTRPAAPIKDQEPKS